MIDKKTHLCHGSESHCQESYRDSVISLSLHGLLVLHLKSKDWVLIILLDTCHSVIFTYSTILWSSLNRQELWYFPYTCGKIIPLICDRPNLTCELSVIFTYSTILWSSLNKNKLCFSSSMLKRYSHSHVIGPTWEPCILMSLVYNKHCVCCGSAVFRRAYTFMYEFMMSIMIKVK